MQLNLTLPPTADRQRPVPVRRLLLGAGLDDRAPFGYFGRDFRYSLVRRARVGLRSVRKKLLLGIRAVERPYRFLIEAAKNGIGRFGRQEQPQYGDRLVARDA